MKDKVLEIWPEINWIKDENLRSKTLDAWVYAIEKSPLDPKDLEEIPFSLPRRRQFLLPSPLPRSRWIPDSVLRS